MTAGWDVIVIGGGPAGCTVAATLSGWGRRTLLLEGARFPRYHPGESLSPACWTVLDGLGVGAAVRDAGFVTKAGSTFVWGPRRERWSVYYGQAGDDRLALQVRRAEFDHILLRHAAAAGVAVREACRVRQLLRDGDRVVGVLYDDQDGGTQTAEAPWVVDATGRDAFIARRLGLIEYEPGLANGVVWAYWEGGGRLAGRAAGNTLFVDHEDGVTWSVPLDDGTLCAGAVIRPAGRDSLREEPDRLYRRSIAALDAVEPQLTGARRTGPVRVGSASAYCASRLAGPGWLLVGDAACFVDPIIAGGVQLALHHGALAALVLNTVLDEPESEAGAAALYNRLYRQQYDAFARIASNVYGPVTDETAPAPIDAVAGRPPDGAALPADAGDRLAFLSVVSGLPRHRLPQALGEHAMPRRRAEDRRGGAISLGEEEGFAFLTRLFHRERLRAGRARRIDEELAGESMLRQAPGAEIGPQLFLPAAGERRLVRRRAAANRFGDRFEPSRALEVLLAQLDGSRTCSEVEQRFGEELGAGWQPDRAAFRRWIELLADQGLVEWQRRDDRVLAPVTDGAACAG
jgi:flavin-dependent dehydrogenase